VPFPWAVALGLAAGLAVAAGIAVLPPIVGLAAAVVVIGLAGAAAWSAQPVGLWEVEEDEEKEPFLDMVAIEGGSFVMGSPEGGEGLGGLVEALNAGEHNVSRAVRGLDGEAQEIGVGGAQEERREVEAALLPRRQETRDLVLADEARGEEIAGDTSTTAASAWSMAR